MDPGVRCHGMKANPTGYLWSKCECFLMSGCQDIDFYKTLTKWNRNGNGNGNGNGNAYDRGDYNSSFALRAVELKTFSRNYTKTTALERSVASKLPGGGLRILHCAQTFALDLGAIPCTINN